MHTLILIERDPPSYSSWPSLKQKKTIPNLSVQEVVSKYKGFEGELLYFFEIKEYDNQFKKDLDQCFRLKPLGSCVLLHVLSGQSEMPLFLQDQTSKLGYDVGVCEEEATIYSSIFHEVLFGYFEELIYYKNFLNDNFLFADRYLAEQYVATHDELSAQGKEVEDYMEMTIYEVWEHKD